MTSIRSAGSGRPATASAFLRSIAEPAAGLVLCLTGEVPLDWPLAEGSAEANLGHALGWTCEVRRDTVILVNPLGEGMAKAPIPALPEAWLEHCRHDGSTAIYLAPALADAGFAELTIAAAGSEGSLRAATVRTSVSADHGTPPKLGRNEPCHCGSGRKFKHCHG